jgi:3-dehydroquinate dehydratase-1
LIIKEGADIVKIATTVQNKADAARILSLYEHYQSLVALGMGDEGKITRIASPLLGAPFTFAAPNTSKTASGQMTDVEMSTIYKIIEGDA